jgi:hypothetical protein
MLKHNPNHAQRTMANLTQNICLFYLCQNQLWAKTQTDRVNGCRPSLLQLGLGLGFKELVVPWRRLFLLRLRLVVVGVGWSAFYFVCELLSKRSVCSRRLSREPLHQRKLYGQGIIIASTLFLPHLPFSSRVFFITLDGSSLRGRLFLSCKCLCFEGKFRFFFSLLFY